MRNKLLTILICLLIEGDFKNFNILVIILFSFIVTQVITKSKLFCVACYRFDNKRNFAPPPAPLTPLYTHNI